MILESANNHELKKGESMSARIQTSMRTPAETLAATQRVFDLPTGMPVKQRRAFIGNVNSRLTEALNRSGISRGRFEEMARQLVSESEGPSSGAERAITHLANILHDDEYLAEGAGAVIEWARIAGQKMTTGALMFGLLLANGMGEQLPLAVDRTGKAILSNEDKFRTLLTFFLDNDPSMKKQGVGPRDTRPSLIGKIIGLFVGDPSEEASNTDLRAPTRGEILRVFNSPAFKEDPISTVAGANLHKDSPEAQFFGMLLGTGRLDGRDDYKFMREMERIARIGYPATAVLTLTE